MRRAIPLALIAISVLALVPSARAAPPRVVAPAVEDCRPERGADPEAFALEYAGARGRHAMRRCVAETLAESDGALADSPEVAPV